MADDNLKKMLNEAMKKPRNFALAVKGSEVALFVSKKPIQNAMLKELKARVGASKTFEGVCHKDSTGFKFRSTEAIGEIGVKLKAHIKEETGLTIDPVIEKVDTLKPVDEELELHVSGGSSAIDVHARQVTEMEAQVKKMREFVNESTAKKQTFDQLFQEADTKRKEAAAKASTARKELTNAKKEVPVDDAKVQRITKDVETLDQLAKDLMDERISAKTKVDELVKLTRQYSTDLQKYDSLDPDTQFDARFELMQPHRAEDIAAVREEMNKVYEQTNRRLVVLGRTADTFQGDQSWYASHQDEGGRVLHADNWSMAVNDAFIKAGLDQKADFAMITRFKNEVLAKIKELLMNPGGRSKEDLKKELRAFVKQEADPALFTGGRYNEGFAVSMVELEQLIDDDYVMMVHDPDAAKITDNDDLGQLKPIPVMVPSGTGQKIKDELAEAVTKRDERVQSQSKRIQGELMEVLTAKKYEILEVPAAKKLVGVIRKAMEDKLWNDADRQLNELRRTLGMPEKS